MTSAPALHPAARLHAAPLTLALAFALAGLVAGCGSDAPSAEADAGADIAADTAGSGDAEADAEPFELPPVPEGVTLRFDADAERWEGEAFYDIPFPSDLRRDDDGTIAMRGMPNDVDQFLLGGLLEGAEEMRGFSSLSVAWFRFDADVALPSAVEEGPLAGLVAADAEADVFLVNVDPDSAARGALVPLEAQRFEEDPYLRDGVLGLAAWAGYVLDPDTTYAYVIRRSLGDTEGEPLGVPETLWRLAHGDPALEGTRAHEVYAPLWPTLDTLGLAPDEVAAATVFTTADVVQELHDLTEAMRARYTLSIDGLTLDPESGGARDGFCHLVGTVTVPEHQLGSPPFNDGGSFEWGDDGLPVQQFETTIPVVITIPRAPMPSEGYPLMLYFHGSGGVSAQVVDRGRATEPGDPGEPGYGPAYVVAQRGFASAGSAHPINPERVPGATDFAYLNFNNLSMFRDLFRQGVIEQRLYLDALLALELDPALLEGCEGPTLPDGQDAFLFDPDGVVTLGQSMGAVYVNIVSAIDPRVGAGVPTGAGGYWSYMILSTDLVPGAATLFETVFRVGDGQFSRLHPTLHALQTAWEPAEPFVYMPRLARLPLDGHPRRPIYEPVGLDDRYFSTDVFDAAVLAYGHRQAGETVWERAQAVLSLAGLEGIEDYPVRENMQAADGSAYTSVFVQYEGDGILDSHNIFQQLDEVKHQYGCFLETHVRDGVALVPAPAALGAPCE